MWLIGLVLFGLILFFAVAYFATQPATFEDHKTTPLAPISRVSSTQAVWVIGTVILLAIVLAVAQFLF